MAAAVPREALQAGTVLHVEQPFERPYPWVHRVTSGTNFHPRLAENLVYSGFRVTLSRVYAGGRILYVFGVLRG